MENVDRMIFDSLSNDLHCSFVENADCTSLKDLGSDQIVEGIVRCLWKCNPATKNTIPSFRLPGNAVDRFRIASKISSEIKSIGVREEQIGYQALLYPNVFDTRRIFLALFEKLPKETVKVEEKKLTPLEKLKADVGEAIARQMAAEHWVPEFCRLYELQRIGRFWHPKESASDDLWAQIDRQFGRNELAEEAGQKEPPPTIAPKPKLPPKPSKVSSAEAKNVETAKSEEEGTVHKMAATTKLTERITEKRAKIMGKRSGLMEMNTEIGRCVDELQKCQRAAAETMDERLLVLLEDPAGNVEKLKNFVGEANNRRMALQEKFFAAKAERLERLNESSREGGANAQRDRLAQWEQAIASMEERREERRRIRAKLLKESQKIGEMDQHAKDIDGRNKFVRRILEISAMVAKQNDEIRRTANYVQSMRKEIDQLEGHLERTLTAINGWMAEGMSERDLKMQRTHKMLVRTHEQCSLVKEAIQCQGQLSRQMDELTDRVDLEAQKEVDGQLERLLDDLLLIRTENHGIEAKLAGRRRAEEEEE